MEYHYHFNTYIVLFFYWCYALKWWIFFGAVLFGCVKYIAPLDSAEKAFAARGYTIKEARKMAGRGKWRNNFKKFILLILASSAIFLLGTVFNPYSFYTYRIDRAREKDERISDGDSHIFYDKEVALIDRELNPGCEQHLKPMVKNSIELIGE